MKIETLKKDFKKKIATGIIEVISITSALIFVGSFAKYQLTENIPLVNGTINYKVPDMRVVAVNISEDRTNYTEENNIPGSGYMLNTSKSLCKVYYGSTSIEEAPKDNDITIEYKDGKINFFGVSKKSTSCYLYFDKIRDTEKPVISNVEATEITKPSITVKVTATDNERIANYYYSINNETYTKSTTNTHTFSDLAKGISYTIKVNTSGNESDVSTTAIRTENDVAGNTIIGEIKPKEPIDNMFTNVATTDEGIFKAKDNDGESYFFRGTVENNYIKFANKWWRIEFSNSK